MAATSQDVIQAVKLKAFENPGNRPNLLIVNELPELPFSETCYIIQRTNASLTVVYVTDTCNCIELLINDPILFMQEALSLLQGKTALRLSTEVLSALIKKHSATIILDSDTLARQFVTEVIYKKDPVLYDSNNKKEYLNQIKQLLHYFKTELIPFYYPRHEVMSVNQNIDSFYAKVSIEIDTQTVVLMHGLQSALTLNCYVFAMKNDKQFGGDFRHLCEQMGNCGPGSITSVILKSTELKGLISKNTELSTWLTRFRKTTFDRLIQQHRENKDVSLGMDVHLRPTFFHIANGLELNIEDGEEKSLSALNDTFVSEHNLGIDEQTVEWAKDYFHQHYNRTSIIDFITNEFLSRCPKYEFNLELRENQRYLVLSDTIQEGLLKPLFNLKHQPMDITQFIIPGTEQRRGDFSRNLRAYVEQLLIEESYISQERTLAMSLQFRDNGMQIRLNRFAATDMEHQTLTEALVRALSRVLNTVVTSTENGLTFQCANPGNYYTALLSIGDILDEFDIDKASLSEIISALTTAGHISAEQAAFLASRLDTGKRSGLNPRYVIEDETEACQLLDWDANTDTRDPSFLGLARHVSGQTLLEWALSENKLIFLVAFVLTSTFDPAFDPAFDESFNLPEEHKSLVINVLSSQFSEISAQLIKRKEFSKIAELLTRLPTIDDSELNKLMALLINSGLEAGAADPARVSLVLALSKRGATLAGADITIEKYLQFIIRNNQTAAMKSAFDMMNINALEHDEKRRLIAVLKENANDKSVHAFLQQSDMATFRTTYSYDAVLLALQTNELETALTEIVSLYSPLNFNTLPVDALNATITRVLYGDVGSIARVEWFILLALKLAPMAWQRGDQDLYRFLVNEASRLQEMGGITPEQLTALAFFISSGHRIINQLSSNQPTHQNPMMSASSSVAPEADVTTVERRTVPIQQLVCPHVNWNELTRVSRELERQVITIPKILQRIVTSDEQVRLIFQQLRALSEKLATSRTDFDFQDWANLVRLLTTLVSNTEIRKSSQMEHMNLVILQRALLNGVLDDSFIKIGHVEKFRIHFNNLDEEIRATVAQRTSSLAQAILGLHLTLTAELTEHLQLMATKQLGRLFARGHEQYNLVFQNISDAIYQTMMLESPLTEDKLRYFQQLLLTVQHTAKFANDYLLPCQLPTLTRLNLSAELEQFKAFLVTETRDSELAIRMKKEELAQLSSLVPVNELASFFSLNVGVSAGRDVINTMLERYGQNELTTNPIVQKIYEKQIKDKSKLESKINTILAGNPKLEQLYRSVRSRFSRYTRAADAQARQAIRAEFDSDFPVYAQSWDRLYAEYELGMESQIRFNTSRILHKPDAKITASRASETSTLSLAARRFFKVGQSRFSYSQYREMKTALAFLQENKASLAPGLPAFKVIFQRASSSDPYSKPAPILISSGNNTSMERETLARHFKELGILCEQKENSLYIIDPNVATLKERLQTRLTSMTGSSSQSTSAPTQPLIKLPILNPGALSLEAQRLLSGEVQLPARTGDKTGYDYNFGIGLVSGLSAGKSGLILRFADNIFTDSFISSIGVDFKLRVISMANKQCQLKIWDPRRRENIRFNHRHGIIYCFDPTDENSLADFIKTKKQLELNGSNAPMVVAFTKRDLPGDCLYTDEELMKVCKDHNVAGLFVSAKMDEGVEDLFLLMNSMMLAEALKVEAKYDSRFGPRPF